MELEIISEEALKELKRLQEISDTEVAHQLADQILCHVLTKLGLEKVVSEFNKIHKWYA